MKYSFKDVLEQIEYNELVKLKEDLESGGLGIRRLIETKINEEVAKHQEQCSICFVVLKKYSTNNYTLVFGPNDFRKKASFCGMDCLEYFINDLKQIKQVMY